MDDRSASPKWAKSRAFFRVFFKKPAIWAVALVLACALWANLSLEETASYDLFNRDLKLTAPLETAVLSDGSAAINDGAQSVVCIAPDGSLKYRIGTGGDQEITGITADGADHLYAYISTEAKGGSSLLKDDVVMYDAGGNLVKTLYTIDYSQMDAPYVRTSPLRYEGGYLYFTGYREYDADLMRLSVDSGAVTRIANVKSTVAFAYNDIEGQADGSYYYAKASGEIGRGLPGQGETALYKAVYTIGGEEALRPFYVRSQGDTLYVYDFWGGKAYTLSGGVLSPLNLTGDFDVNDNMEDFSVCGGKLCGVSAGAAWVADQGVVTPLPAAATVSFWLALTGSLTTLAFTAALPLIILCAAYLVGAAFWYLWVVGHRFAWKLIFTFLLTFGITLVIVYGVFSAEHAAYLTQIAGYQQNEAEMAAQILDSDGLTAVTDSRFLDSPQYETITRQLIDGFGFFQSESDTAAVFLVPDASRDTTIYIASNRGFGGQMGEGTRFSDLVAQMADGRESVSQVEGNLISSCARVTGTGGEIVGYLCMYTTIANVNDEFLGLWSPPVIAGGLTVALIVMLLASRLILARMEHFSSSILKIRDGDFSVRLKNLPPDEVGEVGRCVNMLAENAQNLIDRNTAMEKEIRQSQEEVLIALASITEAKSGQTSAHVKRVSLYVRVLAEDFGYSGKVLEYISTAAMLHDIGKLLVPLEILEKPGKLTPAEFEIIKQHTVDGERLLHNAPGEIMHYARIIALEHHEKWNGKGYAGLAGTAIHLEARITALADVFDALVSRRSYKDAFPITKAYDIITSERGQHFDPEVVDAFTRHFDEFCAIAGEYPDEMSA